jgi:hypothetical protein
VGSAGARQPLLALLRQQPPELTAWRKDPALGRCGEERWSALAALWKKEFKFDPVKDGELAGAEGLAKELNCHHAACEDQALTALPGLAGPSHGEACRCVRELEAQHGERRSCIWVQLGLSPLAQLLAALAGRFTDSFALRDYDSVQLAAANELHVTFEQPVTFACYDCRLNQAAQLLQLQVLP